MANSQDLYGSGLSFPPRVDADGRLVWSTGETNIRECIRVLLLTEPGERVMREQYGCGLRKYLFEPNTATTRELIRQQITNAINTWEPRVSLQQVTVTADPNDARTAAVNVQFRLVATGVAQQVGMTLKLEA